MRAVDRVDDERPDGARGVGPDNRFEDRIANQLRWQPRDVSVTRNGELVGRRVGAERAHAPGWLLGQCVRNEPGRSLALQMEANTRARRRTHRKANALTGRKGERIGRREARRVDPCSRAGRRLKRLRDARYKRRLARFGAPTRSGTRHDMKTRKRIARQRHPGEPAAGGIDRDCLIIHGKSDVAAAAAHTSEYKGRVLRLNWIGGVRIDDGDVQRLACGRSDRHRARGRATRRRARATRRCNEERGPNQSHVAQASIRQ